MLRQEKNVKNCVKSRLKEIDRRDVVELKGDAKTPRVLIGVQAPIYPFEYLELQVLPRDVRWNHRTSTPSETPTVLHESMNASRRLRH